MAQVFQFRTIVAWMSAESEQVRIDKMRQTRVVVPYEEFADYRWKKMKYGTVSGNVGMKVLKGGNQK